MVGTRKVPTAVTLRAPQKRAQLCAKSKPSHLRHSTNGVGWVTSPVSQGALDWSFTLGITASPKATIDRVDAFGRTDFRPDLTSFTMLTLVIHGTADTTVPIYPSGRAAAAGILGTKLIEYEDEPHELFATVPERLNSDLLEFLG